MAARRRKQATEEQRIETERHRALAEFHRQYGKDRLGFVVLEHYSPGVFVTLPDKIFLEIFPSLHQALDKLEYWRFDRHLVSPDSLIFVRTTEGHTVWQSWRNVFDEYGDLKRRVGTVDEALAAHGRTGSKRFARDLMPHKSKSRRSRDSDEFVVRFRVVGGRLGSVEHRLGPFGRVEAQEAAASLTDHPHIRAIRITRVTPRPPPPSRDLNKSCGCKANRDPASGEVFYRRRLGLKMMPRAVAFWGKYAAALYHHGAGTGTKYYELRSGNWKTGDVREIAYNDMPKTTYRQLRERLSESLATQAARKRRS